MHFITLLLALSFLMIPLFEMKIISLLILLVLFLRKSWIFKKQYTFLFLFSLYALAFIYSPYWLTLGIVPPLQYVALGSLFVFGVMWAQSASGDVKLSVIKLDVAYIILLTTVLYALNYVALRADIPWGGDDQYHIEWLIDLFSYLQFFWNNRAVYQIESLSLRAILLIIFLLLFGRKYVTRIFKSRISIFLFLSLVPLSAILLYSPRIFADQKEILELSDVLRYPYFSKWLQLLFIIPDPFSDVRAYRALPFLSQVLMSWYLFSVFCQKFKNNILAFLFSLSLMTIPVVLFYSSLLYLEMPLILCMLICLFHLKKLITYSFTQLTSEPVWYVLLVSTFIKEVAFVFIAGIIFLRMIHRLHQMPIHEKRRALLVSEMKLYFCAVSPLFIYLTFRRLFVSVHVPLFTIKNSFILDNYLELIRSHAQQLGSLFVIALVGFWYLYRRKTRFEFWALSILFFGFTFFFLGYYSPAYFTFGDTGVFAGYSRWILMSVPILISVSFLFITEVKNSVSYFLLLALLTTNVIYHPFSDGVRLPNWGSARADAAEYTYPYDSAIKTISQMENTKKVLWFGHYQPYLGMRFYQEKYEVYPEIVEIQIAKKRFDKDVERTLFSSFMRQVETDSIYQEVDTILYHSVNNIDISSSNDYLGRFRRIKRIQNSEHSLYIFKL